MAKKPLVSKCIFWESTRPHTPLSDEHIWGDWLKHYIRSTIKHHMLEEIIGKPSDPNQTKRTLRAGDPLHSKIKIVCKDCNSGWMSRIQQRAKPHLIPLIKGENKLLGKEAQDAVVSWCTMATMTGEFLT